MASETPDKLLDRVRKLLAKAEDESVTPPEAEALTAKAAELMAKYGIDRALLAAIKPETDAPANRLIDVDNPWGRVKAHLLYGLGSALRCQCVQLAARSKLRVHVFGYASDIERLDILYILGADPDVAWPGRRPGPGRDPEPAGMAALVAAGVRGGGRRAGTRG